MVQGAKKQISKNAKEQRNKFSMSKGETRKETKEQN
jgi:hypothetical protein